MFSVHSRLNTTDWRASLKNLYQRATWISLKKLKMKDIAIETRGVPQPQPNQFSGFEEKSVR
jgi:hypothetical protein